MPNEKKPKNKCVEYQMCIRDRSGEDFWVKAEKLYYTALIGYIWYEAPDHEKNFTTPVSYTHLDVYKRQKDSCTRKRISTQAEKP